MDFTNFDLEDIQSSTSMSNELIREVRIKFIIQNQTPDRLFYDTNYDEYMTVENAIKIIDVCVDTANELDFNIASPKDDVSALKFSKEATKRSFDNGLISKDIYNRYLSKLDEILEQYKSTLS